MADLKTLQRMMYDAVRDEDQLDKTVSLIKMSDKLSQQDRINIYRNSINSVFINTLKSIYPVCQRLVGKQFFSAMSFRYLETATSRSPDLNEYGGNYPEFIADFEHAKTLPYLSDVAQLEWYWHRISLIAPSYPVDLQPIAELSEEELAKVFFSLPEESFLFTSQFPIHEIWANNTSDQLNDHIVEIDSSTPLAKDENDELETTEKNDEDVIDLNQGGVHLILFRDNEQLRMEKIPENIYFILSCFYDDATFGEVAESYLNNNYAELFADAFAICCQQGWVADYKLI